MGEAAENAAPSQEPCAPGRDFGGTMWILWTGFFVLVVYPLSLGPAARLHQSSPATRPAIEAFYAPLTMLIKTSPACRAAAEWYVVRVWRCR